MRTSYSAYSLVTRSLATLALSITLIACSGTPTHNPTTFPYQVQQELLDKANIKTVVIAHVNLGAPSRNYLEKHAPRIDAAVSAYLKENGYKVLPQRKFEQHWNTAVRAFGNPIDPTSGKVNMKTFAQIMHTVRDELAKTNKLDAFIFTDLLEFQVPFSGGLKHLARWDGVTRKPSLQGPGNGVSSDFDWNMQAAVASLQVSLYDMELKALFSSRGGIDATEAIDTRSSKGRYVRRRNLLESENFINEGIQLAFHPLIEMEDWPGNP
ncbi:MAG: hypothetical protein AB8C02_07995 [Halioglobus sp.]